MCISLIISGLKNSSRGLLIICSSSFENCLLEFFGLNVLLLKLYLGNFKVNFLTYAGYSTFWTGKNCFQEKECHSLGLGHNVFPLMILIIHLIAKSHLANVDLAFRDCGLCSWTIDYVQTLK